MDRFVKDLKEKVGEKKNLYCILTVNYNLLHRE
jgi:hypothetical protein